MDFERVAIQTLFYDYPVELAVEVLDRNDDQCLDAFPLLSRWRDMEFTMSEWNLLVQMVKDQWLNQKPFIVNGRDGISKFLLALESVAAKLLTVDAHSEPLVRFEQLFRWRDITLRLGEDALVLPYLAKLDASQNRDRKLFLWPDILHHDNKTLDANLLLGVSDIHAHYNATTDVFHLNWISLMNRLDGKRYQLLKDSFAIKQELSVTLDKAQYAIPFNRLCVAAAYLRLKLFLKSIDSNEKINFDEITSLLKDEGTCIHYAEELQHEINVYRRDSVKTATQNRAYDYAFVTCQEIDDNKDSIWLLYQGERQLIYRLFRKIYQGKKDVWEYAQYLYLYILIKSHIRRELVQTNSLIGFKNFSIYERRKSSMVDIKDMTYWVASKLIYQSAIDNKEDYLEARVVPASVKSTLKKKFGKAVFSESEIAEENELHEHIAFVTHFIKGEDRKKVIEGQERHKKYREDIKKEFDKLLATYEQQESRQDKEAIRVVGIDAAGSELECRPEVFAHLYRYARQKGMLNQTYHVGEDFYDLSDGLRAIDEAIVFMGLRNGCRLGHALALSENAMQYYCARRRNVVISKQYMLDDCVWLYYRAKEFDIIYPTSLEMYLLNTAAKLYYEIGYSKTFNSLSYWHSMLLRGDEVNAADDIDENSSDLWYRTSKCKDDRILVAQKDKNAKGIYKEYHKSKTVRDNGRKICIERWKEGIGTLVADIQSAMRREISEKRIAIECCPSSNLKIGHFNRYDEHPIFTFRPIEPKATDPILNVSINTDDRGVFATSLYNEYSLIALAMTKMKDENGHAKYNEEHILDYIERIRQNGFKQRFK